MNPLKIRALRDEAHKIKAEAGDNITAEQLDLIEAKLNEADSLEASAQRLASIEARVNKSAPQSIQSGPVRIESGKAGFESDPACGFKTPNEFFKVVMKDTLKGCATDERVRFLSAVGNDEQNTADNIYGGFAVSVPPAFTGLMSVNVPQDPTVGRTMDFTMDGASVDIDALTDKNHTSNVTGGIQVYRRGEMGSITSSRAAMEKITMKAHSLDGLMYSTDEMIQDAPSAVAAILAKFPQAFADKEFREKLNGTGAGQFDGVFNSPAKVTVAKESGQTAATITATNLLKMMAAQYNLMNSIWIVNQTALPQIGLIEGGTSGSGALVWSRDASAGLPSTLFGLPLFFSPYANVVGSEGDISLVDWSQYLIGTRGQATADSSIHVRFDSRETAFRFGKRNAGTCWWRSALTPVKGTSVSPIVTLAVRA